jgi:hypothetical protein
VLDSLYASATFTNRLVLDSRDPLVHTYMSRVLVKFRVKELRNRDMGRAVANTIDSNMNLCVP